MFTFKARAWTSEATYSAPLYGQGLVRGNALAYLGRVTVTKKKKFFNIVTWQRSVRGSSRPWSSTPGVKVIKPFFSVTDAVSNKLQRLPLAIFSRGSNVGRLLPYIRPCWKKNSRDKHSSLFRGRVSDEEKRFNRIDTRLAPLSKRRATMLAFPHLAATCRGVMLCWKERKKEC